MTDNPVKTIREALESADAGVWDKHYSGGLGLSVEYARCVHDEICAALKALTAIEEEQERQRQRYRLLNEDAMVAHRWFAEHFGEVMNGRDFAVKCPMADEALAGQK